MRSFPKFIASAQCRCKAAQFEDALYRELTPTRKFRDPARDGDQGSLARWPPPKPQAEGMKSAKLRLPLRKVSIRDQSTRAGRESMCLLCLSRACPGWPDLSVPHLSML